MPGLLADLLDRQLVDVLVEEWVLARVQKSDHALVRLLERA